QGLRVHVVADAVASRNTYDWKVALRRMADAGVAITTTESVMFEWCEVAGTDEFKQISRLITGRGNSGEAQT
ncbi:MAG: isochorismatase family protein, partial [Planctomycetaceae bacterium]